MACSCAEDDGSAVLGSDTGGEDTGGGGGSGVGSAVVRVGLGSALVGPGSTGRPGPPFSVAFADGFTPADTDADGDADPDADFPGFGEPPSPLAPFAP
ncbi:hypothetical protein [Streptomyces sp. NPDC058614]|uniref:hypothetical protein n=1 Tax=Streptomyces sp. NPDC058614 TaxID=3346557 RepID=UPI00365D9A65